MSSHLVARRAALVVLAASLALSGCSGGDEPSSSAASPSPSASASASAPVTPTAEASPSASASAPAPTATAAVAPEEVFAQIRGYKTPQSPQIDQAVQQQIGNNPAVKQLVSSFTTRGLVANGRPVGFIALGNNNSPADAAMKANLLKGFVQGARQAKVKGSVTTVAGTKVARLQLPQNLRLYLVPTTSYTVIIAAPPKVADNVIKQVAPTLAKDK